MSEIEVRPLPPKVTRVRLVIQFSDGQLISHEAVDPQLVEFDYGGLPVMDAGTARGLLGCYEPFRPSAMTVRIEGGMPYLMQIYADSGEIPPALARQALGRLDDAFSREVVRTAEDDPLRKLRMYLRRIAGTSW